MRSGFMPVAGAFVTLAGLYLVGVVFLLDPIAASDVARDPPLPQVWGFLIAIALYIAWFAWVVRQVGSPIKAAMIVAVSQLLLVDVDFVLSGQRGLPTAAASAILLLVGWGATGWVYARLRDGSQEPADLLTGGGAGGDSG